MQMTSKREAYLLFVSSEEILPCLVPRRRRLARHRTEGNALQQLLAAHPGNSPASY
jgi:hypothetical protein